MRITIKHEKELPPHAWGRADYIRSKSDQTVLIGPGGDTYVRADGKRWKYPAVEVTGGGNTNNPVERRSATAYADHDVFPYDGPTA